MNYIIKCKGIDCPKNETCFRYKSEPHPKAQEYFARMPNRGDFCQFYVKTEPQINPFPEVQAPIAEIILKPKLERQPKREKSKRSVKPKTNKK